ncbi:MAG: tetratricopeptide repeat protein, partial [Planctomycetes bacterium]|nr:tetratricopeptide repeat protein [Planctomycetota bacterium]
LQDQLNQNPKDEDLQQELFNAYLLAGDFDQADDLIFQFESINPRSTAWLDAHIKLDIARGNPDRALTRVEELTMGRTSPDLEIYKIQILEAGGNIQTAIERLEKLIADNPDHTDTYNWRLLYSSLLERRGDTDQAIAEMESLSKDFPDDAMLKNNLGYTLIEAHQDIERAARLVLQSHRNDPESAPTLDTVGWYYYKKGDFQQAREYITQAAARLPEIDPDILTHLGDIAYRLDNIDQARSYWNLAWQFVTRRLPLERRFEKNKIELENRLQQLQDGTDVSVAELFK